MTQKQLFGTDGIRGEANKHPITVEMMLALGRALAHSVQKSDKKGLILIGKDTRASGCALEKAVAVGACSLGTDVCFLGPLPTPGVACLTQALKADAGVMISASHNPYTDNGVKIFGADGFKLSDTQELELEDLMLNPKFESLKGKLLGKTSYLDDAIERYVAHLKSMSPRPPSRGPAYGKGTGSRVKPGMTADKSLQFDNTLSGLKVVLDCANGAAYKTAPELFKSLGAQVAVIGDKPDGLNINREVGSLAPQAARKKVLSTNAQIAVVLDGDADRVVFIDETGEQVSGDAVLALIACYLKDKGQLAYDTLVCTEMSNLALEKCLNSKGIQVLRAQVGDRYVVEQMRKGGFSFGGEESGHLIFTNHGTTGDGIAAALMVLAIMQESKKPLSELKQIFKPLPRAIENRLVPIKIPFEQLPLTSAMMREVERRLHPSGRSFIRYSGTEKKVRILIEGEKQQEIVAIATKMADLIQNEINSLSNFR
ncbi:MAG: phosphoglucosamine mutase [Deltaproteobacteria bacterium]|nr:phosphoglucosamine mutase [Deltaproteobacteria bacterium]